MKKPFGEEALHDLKEGTDSSSKEQEKVLSLEEKESESYRDRWLRAEAEKENLRKRIEKEKDDQVKYALFRFAKELIVIADNLDRALVNIPEDLTQGSAQFYQGVKMTSHEINRVFKEFGIQKIDALGHSFDPHYHQVIFEKEDNTCEARTILEVLQEGYKLHERLLRPALVSVSKKKLPEESA